jgi:hypothetical protein
LFDSSVEKGIFQVSKRGSNSAEKVRTGVRLLLDMILFLAVIAFMEFAQRKPPPASNSEQADSSTDANLRHGRYVSVGAKDLGDFKLSYEPLTDTQEGIGVRSTGFNWQGIECLIDLLNERLALPFDIVIAFKKCDRPDSFYDNESHEITVCYDLLDESYFLFVGQIRDQATLNEAVRGSVTYTVCHEIGHALIDVWRLPVTGKEEDAADQVAALLLIENVEGGQQMVLDAARFFKRYADFALGEEKLYWDEHSLDEQRFYNILCMLYGHNAKTYSYLIQEGSLPLARAELCNEDYEKIRTSWQTLLAPYMKNPPDAAFKIRPH